MITQLPARWDRVVDVVVVGSGGAALVAATLAHDGGAEVLVVEQADMIGGTTAVSGGVAWLPGNHLGRGRRASPTRARTRWRTCAAWPPGREHDPALLEVFVDTAPEVLRYLEERTPRAHAGRAELPRLLLRLRRPGEEAGRPLGRARPLRRRHRAARVARPAGHARHPDVARRGHHARRGLHARPTTRCAPSSPAARPRTSARRARRSSPCCSRACWSGASTRWIETPAARARRRSTARSSACACERDGATCSSAHARASCWRAAASSGTPSSCARTSATPCSRCRPAATWATGS